jgi:hypothetical protein
MKSFEALFDVPVSHRLELVRSSSVGGECPAERWDHQELDHTGELVARYESFVDLDPVMGTARCGWYRYDAEGFLSSWDEDVPELLAFAVNNGPSDRGGGLLAKVANK